MQAFSFSNLLYNDAGSGVPAPPGLPELNLIIKEIQSEDDRGATLIGASFLDQLLSDLLRRFLVELSNEVDKLFLMRGPLESFYSKIQIAYCLGLLTENQFNNLQIIRIIRNQFAHHHDILSLFDLRVASLIKSLKSDMAHKEDIHPRSKFNMVVINLGMSIAFSLERIGHQKLPPKYPELIINNEEILQKIQRGDLDIGVNCQAIQIFAKQSKKIAQIHNILINKGYKINMEKDDSKEVEYSCKVTCIGSIAKLKIEIDQLYPLSEIFFAKLVQCDNYDNQIERSVLSFVAIILLVARWGKTHPSFRILIKNTAPSILGIINDTRCLFYQPDD